MPIFENKKVIVFDLDGTIVRLAADWHSLKRALADRYSQHYQDDCEFKSMSACLSKLVERGDEVELRYNFEIIKKYEGQVAATVIGMLGHVPEVEDVGQETFIRFYRSLPTFRGDASAGTYLTRIAINLCLNELKKRKRQRNLYSSQSGDNIENLPDKNSNSITIGLGIIMSYKPKSLVSSFSKSIENSKSISKALLSRITVLCILSPHSRLNAIFLQFFG